MSGFISGVIVRYLADRGFGFINYRPDALNVFFYHKDYSGPVPKVGQSVEFVLAEINGKPQAVKVKPIAAPAVMSWADDPRRAKAAYTPASPRVGSLLSKDSQIDFGITVETPKDGAQ